MRTFLLCSALLAVGGLAASPAFAADPTDPPGDFTISGTAAFVSQYRFRGIAQSDNKPAVQAGFTVSHASGLYVSAWGSSASAGNSVVDIGGSEIDVYGGYTHELGHSGVTIDAGAYGYIYPGAPGGNIYELYGSVATTYGPATMKAGVNFAPDQRNTSRSSTYVYGEVSGGIPSTPISLHAHVGHTGGAFDYASRDYIDYSVGVSYKWKMLTFDISAVGTNISRRDAARDPLPDGTGVLSPRQTYRAAKSVAVASVTAQF